ncbi:MAG: hypothetical protein MUF51_04640 [Vicinamibacteria bacterium]|jgi:hypothetical protein|nr:hypothetical protein [Vicinamibacteria bacterium]
MSISRRLFLTALPALPGLTNLALAASPKRKTSVLIDSDRFLINGTLTYEGRSYKGLKVEGLLLNLNAAQALWDDQNPATRARWNYPDCQCFDPERNVREFLTGLTAWRQQGVLSFSLNLQGANPLPSGGEQPWQMSAFDKNGSLRPEMARRLGLILDKSDQLGMVPIIGLFNPYQDQRLKDEQAVKKAVRSAIHFVIDGGYDHALIEIAHESSKAYHHDILRPYRIHELIVLARNMEVKDHRLFISASFPAGELPTREALVCSDFILLHGSGVASSERIAEMASQARLMLGFRRKPIVFNDETDARFDAADGHLRKALGAYASWGFTDVGENNYQDGYRCPPVNWGLATDRKRAYARAVKDITGS